MYLIRVVWTQITSNGVIDQFDRTLSSSKCLVDAINDLRKLTELNLITMPNLTRGDYTVKMISVIPEINRKDLAFIQVALVDDLILELKQECEDLKKRGGGKCQK